MKLQINNRNNDAQILNADALRNYWILQQWQENLMFLSDNLNFNNKLSG